MADEPSDAEVDPQYVTLMSAICAVVDETFNGQLKHPHKKVGFVLLTFPYSDTPGRANFMSNGADRRDLVRMFKDLIERFEHQHPAPEKRQ